MKTQKTTEIEKALVLNTRAKKGTYGALEVTVGYSGGKDGYERCDYVEFSSNSELICYEIKVSLSDLQSKNKQTYLGDKNYLVVSEDLLQKMLKQKVHMDSGIGIIAYDNYHKLHVFKRCSKHNVTITQRVALLEGIARAGCRDASKYYIN